MDTYINIKVDTTKSKSDMDKIFDDIEYLYSTYHKLSDRYNIYDKEVFSAADSGAGNSRRQCHSTNQGQQHNRNRDA